MLIHFLRGRSEWLIDRLVGGAGGRTARKLREHEFWRTHPEEYAMLEAKAERLRRGREKHKRSVAAALAGMKTRCAPAQRVLFLFLSDDSTYLVGKWGTRGARNASFLTSELCEVCVWGYVRTRHE